MSRPPIAAALIVGVQELHSRNIADLECVKNDAFAAYALFQKLGFHATALVDVGADELRTRLDRVLAGLRAEDFLLVYLIGHGVVPTTDVKQLYFVCRGADRVGLPEGQGCVSLSYLVRRSEQVAGLARWFVFDTCVARTSRSAAARLRRCSAANGRSATRWRRRPRRSSAASPARSGC